MKADYVHKDTLTATDYVELNKNNELLISYNQALLKENQESKKQLENYKKLGFKHLQDKNNNLETQQKEFIKWLESIKFIGIIPIEIVYDKYKEIIGGND